jgi:uncharacterized protein (DUF2267 family)
MNDVITTELLLDAMHDSGLRDRGAARRIVHATLQGLMKCLTSDERATFARGLSPLLREGLDATGITETVAADELYRRVAQRAHVGASTAREQAQVVIETVGRHISYEIVRRLAHAFPSEIAELFQERAVGAAPPYAETFSAAQTHSVVREDNPHGDRKLSSGHPNLRPSDDALRSRSVRSLARAGSRRS